MLVSYQCDWVWLLSFFLVLSSLWLLRTLLVLFENGTLELLEIVRTSLQHFGTGHFGASFFLEVILPLGHVLGLGHHQGVVIPSQWITKWASRSDGVLPRPDGRNLLFSRLLSVQACQQSALVLIPKSASSLLAFRTPGFLLQFLSVGLHSDPDIKLSDRETSNSTSESPSWVPYIELSSVNVSSGCSASDYHMGNENIFLLISICSFSFSYPVFRPHLILLFCNAEDWTQVLVHDV